MPTVATLGGSTQASKSPIVVYFQTFQVAHASLPENRLYKLSNAVHCSSVDGFLSLWHQFELRALCSSSLRKSEIT